MGGGDLNMKKSWHPLLHSNQERVWQQEKKALDERKKLAELQKELAQERAVQELQRLQAEAGGGRREERVDWMYAAPAEGNGPNTEELEAYLLGKKRVDKLLQGNEEKLLSAPTASAPAGSFTSIQNANSTRDTAAKIREDPLLAIKRQEQLQYEKMLKNPKRLKELRSAREQAAAAAATPHKDSSSSKRKREEEREERRARKEAKARKAESQHQNYRDHDRHDHRSEDRSDERRERSGKSYPASTSSSSHHEKGRESRENYHRHDDHYHQNGSSHSSRYSRDSKRDDYDDDRYQSNDLREGHGRYAPHGNGEIRRSTMETNGFHTQSHREDYRKSQDRHPTLRSRSRSPPPPPSRLERSSHADPQTSMDRTRPSKPDNIQSNGHKTHSQTSYDLNRKKLVEQRLAQMQADAAKLNAERSSRLVKLEGEDQKELKEETIRREKQQTTGMGPAFLRESEKQVFSGGMELGERLKRSGRVGLVGDRD